VLELKELKRICLEELKKDLLAGKVEGLPSSQSAAFASNKRPSNMTAMNQKKDSKQNHSQNTIPATASNGELITNVLIQQV
jgi:hypothetical protein